MLPIPNFLAYTIDAESIVRNSKGDIVKVDSKGRVALWSAVDKKSIKFLVSDLFAQTHGALVNPEFGVNPWETEPAEAIEVTIRPVAPLDEAWTAKRSKISIEAIHAICRHLQAGHKARVVKELVLMEFPEVYFSRSLVADIKGGWLHHDIVRQYGIKPQHRGMNKKRRQ